MKPKLILTLFMALWLHAHAFSQADWLQFKEVAGVRFSVRDLACQGEPYAYKIIKVENGSGKNVNVSFRTEMYYAHGCDGCDGSAERATSLSLVPGQTLVGACTASQTRGLNLLVSHSGLPELHFERFELKDITVVPVQ